MLSSLHVLLIQWTRLHVAKAERARRHGRRPLHRCWPLWRLGFRPQACPRSQSEGPLFSQAAFILDQIITCPSWVLKKNTGIIQSLQSI